MPRLSVRNLLTLACLQTCSASAQGWRRVGPPGGDVESLAAIPGSIRALYLGTSDGHVFGSRDSGEDWNLLGQIGEHHDDVIMFMAVDPRSADTIYATSWTLTSRGGGVYQSMDGGHNWELFGLAGLVILPVAIAHPRPHALETEGLFVFEACATSSGPAGLDADAPEPKLRPSRSESDWMSRLDIELMGGSSAGSHLLGFAEIAGAPSLPRCSAPAI